MKEAEFLSNVYIYSFWRRTKEKKKKKEKRWGRVVSFHWPIHLSIEDYTRRIGRNLSRFDLIGWRDGGERRSREKKKKRRCDERINILSISRNRTDDEFWYDQRKASALAWCYSSQHANTRWRWWWSAMLHWAEDRRVFTIGSILLRVKWCL